MEVVKYYSTVGMTVSLNEYDKPMLVRFSCDLMEDGTRRVQVESGHSLGLMKKCGTKVITEEQAQLLFDDDNVVEFNNFSRLFGVEA